MYGSLQRREEKRLKVYFKSKKDVNEQFGRKVNQDVNGNRKLFWKEVSKVSGRNMKKYEERSRVKDGNGRLVLREDEVRIKSIYVNSRLRKSERGWERVFQNLKWCETRFYHVHLAFQRIYSYGCNHERGESGDGKDGSKVSEREKRVEIQMTWFCVESWRNS